MDTGALQNLCKIFTESVVYSQHATQKETYSVMYIENKGY